MSQTVADTVLSEASPAGASESALAGTTLAGRYDVLELVASGGMGAVYRARDRELDEIVALKVIRSDLAALPSMVERFRHEVKLARRVTHVNVARTFELGTTTDGVMFCTMELVEGESLARRLEQRGALGVAEAAAIAAAVCEGVAAAHAAGVVHRDIKPDNVLIAHDGRVVVADFGVAAAGAAAAAELSGTPAYMAPEQARGEPATPSSDVYAIGVLLYETLTGRPPFHGTLAEILVAKQEAEQLVPSSSEVPAALASVIGHATAREPEKRIATARGLRDALATWAGRSSVHRIAMPVAMAQTKLTTLVVLAPRSATKVTRMYLATAIHESLLARLGKMPRLRVLPRASSTGESATFTIAFEVSDLLGVTITPESGSSLVLSFPLSVEQVDVAAAAIAATVEAELAGHARRDDKLDRARDLMLQARDITYRDFVQVEDALARLGSAHELAPTDARILAAIAVGYMRTAFFRPELVPGGLATARNLAIAAVTAAPDLADAHIACGHLELTAGRPERAASHFRIAIGLAPYLAEAHEQLGRMLLEAGYLDAALSRLDEAIAISPMLRTARWEIARAHALDGRWSVSDALVTELIADGIDRPMSRARYAWWRSDWKALEALRANVRELDRLLWPGIMDALFGVFIDKAPWAQSREVLFTAVRAPIENLRRRVFFAQLSAEAAAFAGARADLVELLHLATDDGLFDLHWLDHCVMFASYRTDPGVLAVRERIAARAHAILDALYSDHDAALSATRIA